jgi:hypothetical protein
MKRRRACGVGFARGAGCVHGAGRVRSGGRAHRGAALLVLALCLALPGCYTYHLYQVGGADGREAGNQPSTEWQSATRHALFWGAVRQDVAVENCRRAGAGIEEVRVDTNMAYLLASVATLGVWVPLRMSWRCARPPVPGGVIGDTIR